jgi:hypothetical protein
VFWSVLRVEPQTGWSSRLRPQAAGDLNEILVRVPEVHGLHKARRLCNGLHPPTTGPVEKESPVVRLREGVQVSLTATTYKQSPPGL